MKVDIIWDGQREDDLGSEQRDFTTFSHVNDVVENVGELILLLDDNKNENQSPRVVLDMDNIVGRIERPVGGVDPLE